MDFGSAQKVVVCVVVAPGPLALPPGGPVPFVPFVPLVPLVMLPMGWRGGKSFEPLRGTTGIPGGRVGGNVGAMVVTPVRGATVVAFGGPVGAGVVVVSVAFARVTFKDLIFGALKPFLPASAGSAAGVSQWSPVSVGGHSHPP